MPAQAVSWTDRGAADGFGAVVPVGTAVRRSERETAANSTAPTAARALFAVEGQLSTPWPAISVITSISRLNAMTPVSAQTDRSTTRSPGRIPYRTTAPAARAAGTPTATTAHARPSASPPRWDKEVPLNTHARPKPAYATAHTSAARSARCGHGRRCRHVLMSRVLMY
ncbi:hypothetical protein ACFYZ6_19575 [Streptomyces rubiginosohelvolus]|uniref:hypothetical protein n=1 Tax=Streptomyces rubiginosohelvolus TaxID=67362 RepID=UPI0036832D6C